MSADMLSKDTTTKPRHGAGTSPITAWRSNTDPTGVSCLGNINIHEHTATTTLISHHSLCGYIKYMREAMAWLIDVWVGPLSLMRYLYNLNTSREPRTS